MNPDLGAAAANNAIWCDTIARLHGCRTTVDGDAWSSVDRTPPLYPDAVTLRPGVDPRTLLDRIDTGPGCSIKDSFADVDFGTFGFELLFEATWLWRARPKHVTRSPAGWHRVTDSGELAGWENAWAGAPQHRRLFRDPILDDESAAVILAGDGSAGAIVNRAAGVVGVTNLFAPADDHHEAWNACTSTAEELFSGLPLVVYTSGAEVLVAERFGFEPIGPVRIWLRE